MSTDNFSKGSFDMKWVLLVKAYVMKKKNLP